MIIVPIILLIAICTLLSIEQERNSQKKEQEEYNRRLDWLHGCKRDRFDFAGINNTPYEEALAILEKLERGEYPIKSNDGEIFNLYNIEDYIAEQMGKAKYFGKGRWSFPVIFVDKYDAEMRENFRQGKVTVGKDYTMYERAQLMTFAEAREYMDNMIRKEMDRI